MTIFNLLSYTDNEVDLAIKAVRIYCKAQGVSTNSETGRKALARAVDCLADSPATPEEIVRKLSTLH